MFAYSINNEYRGLNYTLLHFVIEIPSYFTNISLWISLERIGEGTPTHLSVFVWTFDKSRIGFSLSKWENSQRYFLNHFDFFL